MAQKRKGFTTMVSLEKFEDTTWSFLANVKLIWEYEGMAYLFREAGIPLYGFDRGTTRMNHPIMGLAIPSNKDKNYGVDIYVPVDRKKEALALISDPERLKAAAEIESSIGKAAHEEFDRAARASKAEYLAKRRERRRVQRGEFFAKLRPLGREAS